jgi:AbrB family looped-hinge helix DNA binding protein
VRPDGNAAAVTVFFALHDVVAIHVQPAARGSTDRILRKRQVAKIRFPYYIVFGKEATMSDSTLTAKGQTTIPKNIRDGMGLRPKDKIHFTLLANGTVIMRAKKRSFRELYGSLRKRGRKPIPLSDMSR